MFTDERPTWEAPALRGPTRCEFVVSGTLGDVLTHACRPATEPATQECTFIHAEVPHGWDLSDVMRLFDSREVQLGAVTVVRA
jgi:hypothetical protein